MKNETFDFEKMPGHWVLAKLGKKVLRPGGLELTSHMLHTLKISDQDTVVEFAPGMGVTAKMTLENKPYEYIGVEQNEQAASLVRSYLTDSRRTCIVGDAQNTGLADETASIVYGEAMLTMQSAKQKQQIIAEAKRILRPGGQYAIHEMCLAPDTLDDATKEAVQKDLSKSLRVNARPLTIPEWTQHLESEGFIIKEVKIAPMLLLHPKRLIQDEGILGVAKIVTNIIRQPKARKRVLSIRSQFMKYEHLMQGVTIVAELPK